MAHRWRVLNRRRRRAVESGPRCETCRSRGVIYCRFYAWEKPDRYLCFEDAIKQGFCGICGLFCAGMESFDFGRFPGYCDNCQDEIASNYRDDDDEGGFDFYDE